MRRTHWILWLMLALLPVRGWAVAGMAMPAQAVQAASMAVDATGDADGPGMAAAHGAMPCHQADGGSSADGAGTCQACDWCHAAMGLAPRAATSAAPLPSDPPAAMAERDTGRAAVSGLDRPPRTDLAG